MFLNPFFNPIPVGKRRSLAPAPAVPSVHTSSSGPVFWTSGCYFFPRGVEKDLCSHCSNGCRGFSPHLYMFRFQDFIYMVPGMPHGSVLGFSCCSSYSKSITWGCLHAWRGVESKKLAYLAVTGTTEAVAVNRLDHILSTSPWRFPFILGLLLWVGVMIIALDFRLWIFIFIFSLDTQLYSVTRQCVEDEVGKELDLNDRVGVSVFNRTKCL